MADSPEPAPLPRPWWVVPILCIIAAAVVYSLFDASPMRSLTYSVF